MIAISQKEREKLCPWDQYSLPPAAGLDRGGEITLPASLI